MKLCREVGLDRAILYRAHGGFQSTFSLRASEASKVMLIQKGDGVWWWYDQMCIWEKITLAAVGRLGWKGAWMDGGRPVGWLGQG